MRRPIATVLTLLSGRRRERFCPFRRQHILRLVDDGLSHASIQSGHGYSGAEIDAALLHANGREW